ncbi:GTP-binding protein [Candidatus Parvarchaeota archaeon]|uniref:GTP-binding protein n=1 Tax=Candidatus Acidifodinimicrobium mancum TaxID=2898728 RepID=A0A8T3V1P5_9ARCH|nr:GTP-binding protein [Candidatus Acidifodinimicrobium mancum]MBE5729171.1 GTP-binding protein [Candidatus Acidifodinimicrobium mancum]
MEDNVFGIAKLDGDLNGIPDGKVVIFAASPSVGNEVFGYQVIYSNIIRNKKVLLLLNRASPLAYINDMKDYDFIANNNLTILDAYSNFTLITPEKTDNIKVIQNPSNKDELLNTLLAEMSNGYDILVIDSLSIFVDTFGFDFVKSLIEKISASQNRKISSTLMFTEWNYDQKDLDSIYSKANATIQIRGIEKRVIFGQYFAVIKCDWVKNNEFSSALFKVLRPGGIKLYIPKILVTGPTNAGKSSFIHSSCKNAVSVDRLGGTIALDHGTLDFEGYIADMFGTPGQERFDPLLKMLGGEAIGVILVVDATDDKGFPRAIEMLRKTETYGLPIVVVANKYDLKGALKIDEIKEKLHLGESVPIVPTVAEDLSKVDPNEPTKLKDEGIHQALSILFSLLKVKV